MGLRNWGYILVIVLVKIVISSPQYDASQWESDLPLQCSASCPWTNAELDIQSIDNNKLSNWSLANETEQQQGYNVSGNTPAEWCEGMEFPEPTLQLQLPNCKNITIHNGTEFSVNDKGQIAIVCRLWSEVFDEFQLSDDNTTANVCFPLSPQLLQCGLKRLDHRLYAYDSSKLALRNCQTNDVISIRDYYTSPDNNDIIGCNVSIGNDRGLRCNNIDYDRSEYELSNGNTSIRLLHGNATIYMPEYQTLNDTHIRLCYPMSPAMTLCKLLVLKKYEFIIGSDRKLYSIPHNRYFDLGDYIINKNGEAYYCNPPDNGATSPGAFYYAMSVFQIISAVFVFSAFVIHLLVPKLNYHAKPLLCHMFSMSVMYICLSCRYLVHPIPPTGCYALFVLIYFSSITAFFWINVLAFDLWGIFADLQTSSRFNFATSCDKKHKFIYYSLYAYGVPLVMVLFCIILETQPPMQDSLNLHPAIAMMCWFNERKSALVLCFGPLFALLIVNFIFFGWTVYNLKNATKGVEIVNKERNKQLLFVCIKIFVIMGLFSTIELITFMVDAKGEGLYAADISSAIQGILLFIIYICKPATYRILRKKFCPRSSTATGTTSSKGYERNSTSSAISMESVIADDNSVRDDGIPNQHNKSKQQSEDTV